jgi:glycosyltransferase involved in cell wall biosynthesis
MDWFPNVEGMKWFIETVWPEFHRMEPASKMIIAGKSMPESWFHLNLPGLEVLGEVREPEQVLQRADVLVAPVFSASGVRIKILEALSRGKPVLTHRAGIQGLIVKQLGGVIIANERDEYLRAMFELHRNRDYRRQLSQDALRYTGQFHSRTRVFSRVNQYLRQITGQA